MDTTTIRERIWERLKSHPEESRDILITLKVLAEIEARQSFYWNPDL